MRSKWKILVVDDEPDVHTVTSVALRRRTWRGTPFELTSAHSGAKAREILLAEGGTAFQVCLVDVVMESDRAGLDLCQTIREKLPLSTRIILRTGQPGVAPEEAVLNDYDIDQYLAKTEATPERLYAAVRTSLRGSLDLALMLAVGKQLKALTDALQRSSTTLQDLLEVMRDGLELITDKHSAAIMFVPDLERLDAALALEPFVSTDAERPKLYDALRAAQEHADAGVSLLGGEQFGLSASTHLLPFRALEPARKQGGEGEQRHGFAKKMQRFFTNVMQAGAPNTRSVHGGFVLQSSGDPFSEKTKRDLYRELSLFAENWKVAFAMFTLQNEVVSERVMAVSAVEKHGVPL